MKSGEEKLEKVVSFISKNRRKQIPVRKTNILPKELRIKGHVDL